MEIKNVKGTHDIFGKESYKYEFVETVMRQAALLFSFKQISLPVIEHSELFVRGVGEGSDVVRKEMYTFLDKGDRSITLRPEFTAGIIRSFVQNKMYANAEFPLRLFYYGPVFRYERPQLGRYRQFNQFGVESLGSTSYLADVEVIALAYAILAQLRLKNVMIKINSLGDEETRTNYRQALRDYFAKHINNMCEDCKMRYELNPLRILDCKVKEDQEIIKGAPKISDYYSAASKERLEKVLKELKNLEIPYEVDDSLVRGLDYYSEVVFEFHYTSENGNNYGAIGAGGHYDKLIQELGGPALPGVGLSFGMERLISVIDEEHIIDDINVPLDFYVMPLSQDCAQYAMSITMQLRLHGYVCEMCMDDVKLGAMFKRATRKEAKYAVIIGEDEADKEEVQIKDLSTQEQTSVSRDRMLECIDELMAEKCKNEQKKDEDYE